MKNPVKNNLVIELHVPDFDIVKEFYSKLGFRIGIEDKVSEKEPGYFTMIREDELGETLLNFHGGDERVYDQSFFKQFPKETTRGYAIEITIPVKDIDKLYSIAESQLKENIVRELKEIQYHSHVWKDFRMTDPFGFYLRFTELIDWGQK